MASYHDSTVGFALLYHFHFYRRQNFTTHILLKKKKTSELRLEGL